MRNLSKLARLKLSMGGRKGGSAEVPKGFAKMDKELLKKISRKGGLK
jgi:general stress protein YciG